MRNRWYSPDLRQFLSHDPLGAIDSHNLYAYVGMDPINGWDPYGLSNRGFVTCTDCWAGSGFGMPSSARPAVTPRRPLTSDEMLDAGQATLEMVGLIEGFGAPADLLNASISLGRDRPGEAAWHAGAALPFAGWAVFTARHARHVNKIPRVNLASRHLPFGFKNADELTQFGDTLRSGLAKAGFADSKALFQGSAVTGRSFKSGVDFDVGRVSDFDVALAGPSLLQKAKELGIALRSGGTRTGPLSPDELNGLGLDKIQEELKQLAGRDVNFMIFGDVGSATNKSPSIMVP